MTEKTSRENYTRITTILYPFSGLKDIDQDIVQNAANRGTNVHNVCEGIASGLGEHGVYDEIKGYVESFKKWWSLGHDVITIEQRFWDDDLQITGKCDFITRKGDDLTIVDLKTSYKPSKTWQIQGCAYAYLAKKYGHEIKNIHFIHLDKHGNEPRIYEYSVDDDLFLSVYKTYNHFYKTSSRRAHEKTNGFAEEI